MKSLVIVFCLMTLIMCNSNKKVPENQTGDLAPVIIYKTKADYSNYIPVIMDASRQKIISYPGVRDIFSGNEYARPVKLKDGFLLDKIGISPNSVYTSFTFDEYANLGNPPALEELMRRIVEKDPFIEMYNCPPSSELNIVDEINNRIKNKLTQCKRMK